MIQIKAVVKEASLEGGRLGRMISPSVERVHLGAFSRDECSKVSLPPCPQYSSRKLATPPSKSGVQQKEMNLKRNDTKNLFTRQK